MQLSDNAKNIMLQALVGMINANTSPTLLIYIGDTIAATFVLPNPVEDNITAGVISFSIIDAAVATEDGVPTSCKIQDDLGNAVVELPASVISLDKPQLYIGGNVSVSAFSIRF